MTEQMTGSWRGVLARVWRRSQEHRLAMTAASVAFYVLLGSMPGLAAVVWLYGTFANPDDVARLSSALSGILPSEIADLLGRNIQRLASGESASTRSLLSTVAWLLFILWSANRGCGGWWTPSIKSTAGRKPAAA